MLVIGCSDREGGREKIVMSGRERERAVKNRDGVRGGRKGKKRMRGGERGREREDKRGRGKSKYVTVPWTFCEVYTYMMTP